MGAGVSSALGPRKDFQEPRLESELAGQAFEAQSQELEPGHGFLNSHGIEEQVGTKREARTKEEVVDGLSNKA